MSIIILKSCSFYLEVEVLMELFLSIFLGISGILILCLLNPGRAVALTEVTCLGIIDLDILSRKVP